MEIFILLYSSLLTFSNALQSLGSSTTNNLTREFQEFFDESFDSDEKHGRRRRIRSVSDSSSGLNFQEDHDLICLGDSTTIEPKICDATTGGVCNGKKCVSSCASKGLNKCTCPDSDDNYCYLCCGSSASICKPAHEHGVLKPNGERWERASCARCHGPATTGLSCDDRDAHRVCYGGRCAAKLCVDKPEGAYCDARHMKVCADLRCRDPCKERRADLLTCECDLFHAARCELCCYDARTKRCESAHGKYGVTTADKRPIRRSGLACRYGPLCNFYGVCSGAASAALSMLGLVTSAVCALLLRILIAR